MKVLILTDKATKEEIASVAEHFQGYFKVVVKIFK